MENTFILDVDFKKQNYVDTPLIRQNDTVTFIVNLLDDDEPFDLTHIEMYSLAIVRSDNVSVISSGSKTGDSQATFKLPKSSIAIIGSGKATVQLYSDSGRVSTISFDIKILKDPSDYAPSNDDKTLIELVLGDGPKVIQEAKDATQQALDVAEEVGNTLDDMQTLKEETESVKQATEEERLATKAEREATESVRQLTEAMKNETEQVKNDAKSVKNATDVVRQATEQERLATKSEREATENVRQATETLNTDMSQLKGEVEQLKADTETVKDDTVTAKNQAEQATANANTATSNANNAAEYANTQGKRAEDAADAIDDLLVDGAVASINGKTGIVTLTAGDVGAETPQGAQLKANAALADAKVYTDEQLGDIDFSDLASKQELTNHVDDKDNPHAVTKSQVGLGNVDNVRQATKAEHDALSQTVTTHLAEKASLTKAGHVQLSNATNSNSETLAATPKAIKAAMDRADAAFTSADNGKTAVRSAVIGVDPSVEIPINPSFADLAGAIGGISTGKKWASGEFPAEQGDGIVSGLPFRPSLVIMYSTNSSFVNRGSVRIFNAGEDLSINSMTGGYMKLYFSSTGTLLVSNDHIRDRIKDDGFIFESFDGVASKWYAFE